MRRTVISELSRSLMAISWHFGPRGLDGECCENLTMPEFIALDKVSTTHDCPVQEVGNVLGFSKSGATRVVDRLEEKGYVERARSPEDARICCVVITEKGERMLEYADSRFAGLFDDLVSKMHGHTRAEVVAVVRAMARSMK